MIILLQLFGALLGAQTYKHVKASSSVANIYHERIGKDGEEVVFFFNLMQIRAIQAIRVTIRILCVYILLGGGCR